MAGEVDSGAQAKNRNRGSIIEGCKPTTHGYQPVGQGSDGPESEVPRPPKGGTAESPTHPAPSGDES